MISIVLAVILIFGTTASFAAKPWDLIINAQFEESQIEAGDKPVIYGVVTDQAGRPISGVELRIRFADNSITTTTDEEGNFRHEFGEQRSQGVFSVNISATLYDLKGFATTTLKIGKAVSTFDDIYYTKDFDKDLKKRPIQSTKTKTIPKIHRGSKQAQTKTKRNRGKKKWHSKTSEM